MQIILLGKPLVAEQPRTMLAASAARHIYTIGMVTDPVVVPIDHALLDLVGANGRGASVVTDDRR
eukprot:1232789-Pyramimonas_sp.AAC.1